MGPGTRNAQTIETGTPSAADKVAVRRSADLRLAENVTKTAGKDPVPFEQFDD